MAEDQEADDRFAEGVHLLDSGDYKGAVAAFSEVIAVRPGVYTAAYRNRTEAYRRLRQIRAEARRPWAFLLNMAPLAFAAYFFLSAAAGYWFGGGLIVFLVLAIALVIPIWGSGYLLTDDKALWPLTWFMANAAMWVGTVVAHAAGDPRCVSGGYTFDPFPPCHYTDTTGLALGMIATGAVFAGIAIFTAIHAYRLNSHPF